MNFNDTHSNQQISYALILTFCYHIYLFSSRYRQRQLAFHVQYDGTAYAGFASQDCEDTVENHLFKAFVKLRLIADRQVSREVLVSCAHMITHS